MARTAGQTDELASEADKAGQTYRQTGSMARSAKARLWQIFGPADQRCEHAARLPTFATQTNRSSGQVQIRACSQVESDQTDCGTNLDGLRARAESEVESYEIWMGPSDRL